MKCLILVCFYLIFPLTNNMTQVEQQPGLVPDSITAIKIAEAVWLPIFGKRIYKKKPFIAVLKNDSIWFVQGTLKEKKGGIPYAEIQKKDGKVLSVYHTK